MGRSACTDGHWGPCVTDHLVSKSLPGMASGPAGVHPLSTTTQCPSTDPLCADVCDPNAYTVTTSGAGDIDGAVIVLGDGGVTLPSSGIGCQLALDCPNGSPTTLTGTVRDPAGVNPVAGAYVYVPVDPSGALAPLSSGASCDACGRIDAVAITQTAADGTFVLPNVPSTDVAGGSPIPLVVQLGKWRREAMLQRVPKCQSVAVDPGDSRLPRNRSDGHGGQASLPKMAIATGLDPFECLLLKIGVDPAEFQVPGSGSGRVDVYVAGGHHLEPPMAAPPQSQLVGSKSTLMTYDLVMLPCTGTPIPAPGRFYPNDDVSADFVSAYANAGGRLFTSHFAFTWLATPEGVGPQYTASDINPATMNPNPFFGVASWNLNLVQYASSVPVAIDTTLASGAVFASWMENVGAATMSGALSIDQPRHDIDQVNAPTTEWLHDESAPNEPFLLSFDTPFGAAGSGSGDAGVLDSGVGGAGACGRVAFADFHVSAGRLTQTSGACNTDGDCAFGATCNSGTTGTCAPQQCGTDNDCGHGYTCVGTISSTCASQQCTGESECLSGICNPGGSCGCVTGSECVSGSCTNGSCTPSPSSCVFDRQCGSVEQCVGAIPGICRKNCATDSDCGVELCVFGQCQGCRTNSDCLTGTCLDGTQSMCSTTSPNFPGACSQGPLAPQDDALEFDLLNLTACVAPPEIVMAPIPTVVQPCGPVTFTEDFASSCAPGTRVVWRELDWQASIPSGASISFFAQTAELSGDGGPPNYQPVPALLLLPDPDGGGLVTTQTSTVLPGVDSLLLDTGTTGAFNLANPPILSRTNMRLTVTLTPTPDKSALPTLLQWQIKADCLAAE